MGFESFSLLSSLLAIFSPCFNVMKQALGNSWPYLRMTRYQSNTVLLRCKSGINANTVLFFLFEGGWFPGSYFVRRSAWTGGYRRSVQ